MERFKRLPTWAKWALGIFALLVVIGAASGGGDESSDDGGNASDESAQNEPAAESEPKEEEKPAKKPEKPKSCGTTATDDCTPRVGPNGKVRVDALVWEIQSAKTATSLGDTSIGLGEKANGIYVVANLKVTSQKDESATLSDEIVTLNVDGGNTYKPDSDGTIAAVGAGDEPFFLEDIGPDSTLTGIVVFDVPKNILGEKLELSFGELGLGSTKGYIRLPKL